MTTAKLTVSVGPDTGKSLILPPGSRIIIGRSHMADVQLGGHSVSRHHCSIENDGGVILVKDLGSTNGTFVNRRPIRQSALRTGDLLRIGESLIEVQVPGQAQMAHGDDEQGDPHWPLRADNGLVFRPAEPEEGLSISAAEAAQEAMRAPKSRSVQNLRSLYQIAGHISHEEDTHSLASHICEEVLAAMDGDRAALLLWEENTGDVVPIHQHYRQGIPQDGFEVCRNVVAEVMCAGRAVLSNDAIADERYRSVHSVASQHIRSVMCAPLVGKTQTLGTLYIDSLTRACAFRREDLELLSAIGQQAGVAIERVRLKATLENLFIGAIRTLVATVEAKDPYTHGHSQRVTNYSLAIASLIGLGQDELETLELAGLLHDVGKIGVPERILHKAGPLDDDEFKAIRRHPQHGASIILNIPHEDIIRVAKVVRAHHERWDGGGYPDRLRGKDSPLCARILSVADAYDAMTSDRPYRRGFKPAEAMQRLKVAAGSQFDALLVQACGEALDLGLLGQDQEASKYFLPPHTLAPHAPAAPLDLLDDDEENTQIIG